MYFSLWRTNRDQQIVEQIGISAVATELTKINFSFCFLKNGGYLNIYESIWITIYLSLICRSQFSEFLDEFNSSNKATIGNIKDC